MKQVTVKKDELLEILRKNRTAHRAIFLEAQEGFKKEVIRELEARLENSRKGKHIELFISLDEPVDQTKDYDRAIRMLEMSVNSNAELTETEFSQYVLDDWSWKGQFTSTNSKYLGK